MIAVRMEGEAFSVEVTLSAGFLVPTLLTLSPPLSLSLSLSSLSLSSLSPLSLLLTVPSSFRAAQSSLQARMRERENQGVPFRVLRCVRSEKAKERKKRERG